MNNLNVVGVTGESSSELTRKYNVGDTAYIIESNRLIRETVIIKKKGNFYTVKFKDTNGAITLKAHRLYGTRDEAIEKLDSFKPNAKSEKPKSIRPPHPIW